MNGNCLSENMVLDLVLKYVLPTYYEWICIILYLIVFIVGTIGNLLVIIVIQRNRSMRLNIDYIVSYFYNLFSFSRTVTNMFIMNLAAADLLVLVFCLPATVVQDVTKTWFFGLILCKFVNYIQVFFFAYLLY
jgi:hypocretin (orexin) receptor 2